MTCRYKKVSLIIFISVFLINFINCQDNNTIALSCNTEQPQVLLGENEKKILKIPVQGNEYLNNQNCSFLIKSNSEKYESRILINIDYIDLEEPIFSECSDVLEIYSGPKIDNKKLINKLCGRISFPMQITSNESSLLLVFTTDDIVQRKGFQISYEIFYVPGCPSEWVISNDGTSCLYIFDSSAFNMTWFDGQHICEMSISNLVTFDNYLDYQIISEIVNKVNDTLWVGYQDFFKEGEIINISDIQNTSTWNVPSIPNDKTKNCLAITINGSNFHSFDMLDCREKHSFVCKRSFDKPYTIKYEKFRNLVDLYASNDASWVFYAFVTLTVVFFLVVLYCLLLYCKQHKRNVQVNNHDQNQMLVQDNKYGEQRKNVNNKVESFEKRDISQTKVQKIKKSTDVQDEKEAIYGSAKFEMKANQPNFIPSSRIQTPALKSLDLNENNAAYKKSSSNESVNNSLNLESVNLPNTIEAKDNKSESSFIENKNINTSMSSKLNFLSVSHDKSSNSPEEDEEKEDEKIDSNSSKSKNEDEVEVITEIKKTEIVIEENNIPGLSLVLDVKKKNFERPKVLKISNPSAISLDEFWNNV